MSDAAAAPAKSPKKKASKPKTAPTHPKYSDMIQAAVAALKERGGSSRQAILKYIMKHNNVDKDEKKVNAHLKMALRAGVKNGSLKQAKGTGASGSFRLSDKAPAKAKKAKSPKKAKKPAAKKAAKPKKAKSPKKAAKPKKAKSPKKPKAAKPKKAKSPKKKAAKPKKAAKGKK